MTCATIIASAPVKERTAPLAVLIAAIASQYVIGGFVFQRHAILRPPTNIAGENFDQRICGEGLALFIDSGGV